MSIWVQLKLNRMLFFLRVLLAVAPGGVEVCSVADVSVVASVPEPVVADLKFCLEPERIFVGRLRLLILTCETRNDFKMFIVVLYIFLYN